MYVVCSLHIERSTCTMDGMLYMYRMRWWLKLMTSWIERHKIPIHTRSGNDFTASKGESLVYILVESATSLWLDCVHTTRRDTQKKRVQRLYVCVSRWIQKCLVICEHLCSLPSSTKFFFANLSALHIQWYGYSVHSKYNSRAIAWVYYLVY